MLFKTNEWHITLATDVCDNADAQYIKNSSALSSFSRVPNDPCRQVGGTHPIPQTCVRLPPHPSACNGDNGPASISSGVQYHPRKENNIPRIHTLQGEVSTRRPRQKCFASITSAGLPPGPALSPVKPRRCLRRP